VSQRFLVARNPEQDSSTVTRDGIPVARLSPLPGRALSAPVLLERWRHLPSVGAGSLRRDLDTILDPTL
jgi:antitoxin (DNA-binding transcriptional repressor) of toxin-antitoxin stability system